MDFYIIELEDRIKIGVATCTEHRLTSLLSAGGHGANDVLNLYEFTDTGIIEQPLIRLFKPFLIEQSKYNRGREWFYKKGLVKIFLDEIKRGTKPCKELVQKIQYLNVDVKTDHQKNAIKIFEKIKAERKNIGFPNSVTFEKFLKTHTMAYRNMIYQVDADFNSFTRYPKFKLDEISSSQVVECLRIIKNNSKSKCKKEKIQYLSDSVFNKNSDDSNKILCMIRDYFFTDLSIYRSTKYNLLTSEDIREKNKNNEIIKELNDFDAREIGEIKKIRNPNIRIEHYVKYDFYSFIYEYENLKDEEYALIKKSKNIQLYDNLVSFSYKGGLCTCVLTEKCLPRIKNLLKNSNYEDLTSKSNIEIFKTTEILPLQKRPMKRKKSV